MSFEQATLLAYVVTIVSEALVILAVQRPKNILYWATGIILINSFTHPIVMYLLHIRNFPYIPVEIGVFVVEAFWYSLAFRLTWKRALLVSLIANAVSIIVGVIIRLIFFLE